VERSDARADAQRLTQRPAIDVRANAVGELALEQMWNAAGELDDLNAARHFATCVGQHLAVLTRNDLRQLRCMFIEQGLEAEQDPCALQWWRCGPSWKCGLSGRDGCFGFGCAGKTNLRGDVTGCRVVDRAEPWRVRGGDATVDEVTNDGNVGAGSKGSTHGSMLER